MIDIAAVKQNLRWAVKHLNARGLQKSAKWTSEQLMGMNPDITVTMDSSMEEKHSESIPAAEIDVLNLGCNLMINGDYQRCAHLLRKGIAGAKGIQSRLGLFLASYSLYMAGEKLKDNNAVENSSDSFSFQIPSKSEEKSHAAKPSTSSALVPKNPYLNDLFRELYPVYALGHSGNSEHEMDGFLVFLFALIVRDFRRQGGGPALLNHNFNGADASPAVPSAYHLFIQSLRLYPWNWSCWLELSELCISDNLKAPKWTDICAVNGTNSANGEEEASRVMYDNFLVHLRLENQQGEAALQCIEALSLVFPFSSVLFSQAALAHYAARDYDRAEEAFEHLREADPYRLDYLDTYSNILYVKEKKAELSHLAHTIVKIDKFSTEACCVVGNYFSLKAQHEKAILYFQRALKINRKFLSAWTLMGHEFVELRNTAAAVQCYRRAVEVSSSDYRAWYGLGQTYEMLHLYQYALYYYKKAAHLKPSDARMWCAVGNCLGRMGLQKDAILALHRAVEYGDREGIATRELARIYRDLDMHDRAAECYLRHLQVYNVVPSVTTPSATSGTTTDNNNNNSTGPGELAYDRLVSPQRSNGSPNGNNISINNSNSAYAYLSRSADLVDAERAEGLLFLASYYRSNGELDKAEQFCARLMDYIGPEGNEARAMIRELRSLAMTSIRSSTVSSSVAGVTTATAPGARTRSAAAVARAALSPSSAVRSASAVSPTATASSSGSAATGVERGAAAVERSARLRRLADEWAAVRRDSQESSRADADTDRHSRQYTQQTGRSRRAMSGTDSLSRLHAVDRSISSETVSGVGLEPSLIEGVHDDELDSQMIFSPSDEVEGYPDEDEEDGDVIHYDHSSVGLGGAGLVWGRDGSVSLSPSADDARIQGELTDSNNSMSLDEEFEDS